MAVFRVRWLQRAKATEVARGIAVTSDASASVLLDHLYMINRDNVLRTRAHAITETRID
ncbi:MAG: hypothetical protein QOD11_724 [Bradyrhizobium sp.]|jgi:hypothetical protein|nr:hypothetical protein [Bradyrhizobium sp.]